MYIFLNLKYFKCFCNNISFIVIEFVLYVEQQNWFIGLMRITVVRFSTSSVSSSVTLPEESFCEFDDVLTQDVCSVGKKINYHSLNTDC